MTDVRCDFINSATQCANPFTLLSILLVERFSNARVVNRGRDPGICHVKLICAQLFRRRRIGRAPQKPGEILHRTDMRSLRLLPQTSNAHVLNHSLPKRCCSLLCHWNLLCRLRKPQSSDRFVSSQNARRQEHCETSETSAIAARAASSALSPKQTLNVMFPAAMQRTTALSACETSDASEANGRFGFQPVLRL